MFGTALTGAFQAESDAPGRDCAPSARAAVDEHSRLLLLGEHPGGEAGRRRPYRGPVGR
jgi:hypothetical protein